MAPHVRQLPDLPFLLSPFGDDVDPEIFREIENCANDLRPLDRQTEAGYERPVDFERIDRETTQIVER